MPHFLRRFFKIVAILIGVALLYMVIAGRDIPPPDVSDLLVERVEVLPEENAYTYFIAATNALVWPEDASFVTAFRKGESADVEPIRALIAQNTEATAWLERGVAQPSYQPPDVPDFSTPMPHVQQWVRLANFTAARAKLAHVQGREAEAGDACALLLGFGGLVTSGSANAIEHLVGQAALAMGTIETRRLAHDGGSSPETLRKVAAALPKASSVGASLTRALKGEFRMSQNAVKQMRDGQFSLDPDATSGKQDPRRVMFWTRLPYLFQSHRTALLLAEFHRCAITNASLCYTAMQLGGAERLMDRSHRRLGALLRPNAVGNILLSALLPALDGLLQRKCATECDIAATRLILALNLHRVEKGNYPDALQALVPEYLDAVPLDPYDGQPFRFSPDRRIVYSVGLNLKDDGGSAELPEEYRRYATRDDEQRRGKAKDIVYEFGVPAAAEEPRDP